MLTEMASTCVEIIMKSHSGKEKVLGSSSVIRNNVREGGEINSVSS